MADLQLKSRVRIAAVAGLAAAAVAVAGCSSSSSPSSGSSASASSSASSSAPAKPTGNVNVAYASSLQFLNEKVVSPAFTKAEGYKFVGHGGASTDGSGSRRRVREFLTRPDNSRVSSWRARFATRFGVQPSYHSAYAYDMALVINDAAKRLQHSPIAGLRAGNPDA